MVTPFVIKSIRFSCLSWELQNTLHLINVLLLGAQFIESVVENVWALRKVVWKYQKCYNPHCVKSDFFRYWWCILIIFSYGYFHNCFSHQNGGFQSCLLLSIEVKHPRLILFCSELLKSVPLWRYIVMKTNNDECLSQTGIELMTVRSRDHRSHSTRREVITEGSGLNTFKLRQ